MEPTTPLPPLLPPWKVSLRKALNHGGTRRKKRDRSEAKRKQVQVATVNKKSGRPSCRTMVFRGFCSAEAVTTDTTTTTTADALQQTSNGEDTDKDRGSGSVEATTVSTPSILIRTAAGNDEAAPYPMLITDTRSGKYADFLSGSACEICWWLDEAGVQFRIAGRVLVATADAQTTTHPALRTACQDVWERLSESTKRTFFWAEPGTPKPATVVGTLEGGTNSSAGTNDIGIDTNRSSSSVGPPPTTTAEISPYFALCIVIPDKVDELHLGGKQKRFLYSLKQDGIILDSGDASSDDHADIMNVAQLLQPQEWITEEVNP